MNPPQVYTCSPSLLPPPSPYHPSGSSQCTSPKHPVSCIEPGLDKNSVDMCFAYEIIGEIYKLLIVWKKNTWRLMCS